MALLAGCSDEDSPFQARQRNGSSADRTAPAYSIDPNAALTVTPPVPAGPDDRFHDITQQTGIDFVHQYCDRRIANILESNGSGAAILDMDNDGWMDVYLVNAGPLEGVTAHEPGTQRQPNRLYRNRGDGTFQDVTQTAAVGGHGYGTAAIAGDYDNDGYTDLYVVNFGPNILYRNRGNGTFEDVTERAGVVDPHTGIGAVFTDYDRDGHLDLFVANYLTFDPDYKLYFNPDAYPGPLSYQPELNRLYRNRGNGTFEDVSAATGIQVAGHRAMSVTALDFDVDGDTDFYICNDATPNVMLVNDGQGRFSESAEILGVAFNALGEAAGSMTAAVGDYNGDLLPDILVSRLGYGSLYTGTAQKVFEDRMMASNLGRHTAQYVGWGSNFIDIDNDGDLDAFVANGDAHYLVGWESLLLRNEGNATFTDAVEEGGAYFRQKIRARGSVVSDFNNDGRQDVLVTAMGDRVFLLENRGGESGHWLKLQLVGNRSNRNGFGSRVLITVAGRQQAVQAGTQTAFLGSSDPRLHFGLGPATQVDQIQILWPSGTSQVLKDVPADQILQVHEP